MTQSNGLPSEVAQYLGTFEGQYMVRGAQFFVWEIARKRICTSCNVPPAPTRTEVAGTMIFVRAGNGWVRHVPSRSN